MCVKVRVSSRVASVECVCRVCVCIKYLATRVDANKFVLVGRVVDGDVAGFGVLQSL